MTEHYFENSLVNLHYYKFGKGEQKCYVFTVMACMASNLSYLNTPCWVQNIPFMVSTSFFTNKLN